EQRAREQRLGGDAADVEADAPELLRLHTRHVQPKLRATDRGDVTTRSAPDDHQIEAFATIPSHTVPRVGIEARGAPDVVLERGSTKVDRPLGGVKVVPARRHETPRACVEAVPSYVP